MLGPRLGRTTDEHQNLWFLAKEGGGKVESIPEQELESGVDWTIVHDA